LDRFYSLYIYIYIYIYINDITDDLDSNLFIYADDTFLFEIVDDVDVSTENINDDLKRISIWSKKWLVSMNPLKCQSVVFSLKLDKTCPSTVVFR
jgi:hypothetical protein